MSNLSEAHYQQPLLLNPVAIPKPWGQEIWYTGMESRGVSEVVTPQGVLPLDQYLQNQPMLSCNGQDVLLLKVLDPSPQVVTGDLYFEVHEQKQEVYVVTHVDQQAWPNGEGAIRFGMNQAKRKDYVDDEAFRQAYLSAVTTYEQVRRKIDAGVEGPNDPELEQQEVSFRRAMESFTQLLGLKTGDVVQVPTWTPHALQHGVRVVEFQTPTYERYIVSFAQKVLTQDHWDTAHAVANMHIDPPALPTLPVVSPGVERIAAFDDFEAWRIDHSTSPHFNLPPNLPYAVCMSLTDATVANLTLQPEQACFIPHQACCSQVTITATQGHTLLAAPRLST